MQVFGNGDEPSTELKVFFIGLNLIKGIGKGSDGNVFRIVLIFGAKQLKTVYIIPEGVQKKTKGNLISLLGSLNTFLNGICLVQKCVLNEGEGNYNV